MTTRFEEHTAAMILGASVLLIGGALLESPVLFGIGCLLAFCVGAELLLVLIGIEVWLIIRIVTLIKARR